MKKSTLALAVAAALVGFGSAAYADTTLYGSARVSVDYDDLDTNYQTDRFGGLVFDPVTNRYLVATPGIDAWDVFNNASRLGVRGEEDLGGGLAAIYQYEFGVDVTEGGNFNNNRPKWVGLRGPGWGSVTIGTQWTPYYNVMGIADIFNTSKVFSNSSIYLGNAYGTRMDNSLIYSTPNWSGFSGQAMLVMNGQCAPQDPLLPNQLSYRNTTDSSLPCVGTSVKGNTNLVPANLANDLDMWGISLSYKNGPWFAGATYMALEGPDFTGPLGVDQISTKPTWDGDQYGLAFGWNSGPFAVTLNWESGDANNWYYGTTDNIFVTGQYTFGNNVIRGAYGYLSPDDAIVRTGLGPNDFVQQSDINNWVLGYQYNFSKRTRVWVEYIGQDTDADSVGARQVVSIGTRVDF